MVVGYYGYGNFGDELLLKSARKILKSVGFNSIGILYPSSYGLVTGVKIYKRFSVKEVVPAIKRSHTVVFGGGGLFQDVTSFRSFLYYYALARISILLKKHVIFLGTSFGPLKKAFSRFLIKEIVKRDNVHFFPRDRVSLRYLNHIGGNVYPGMDLAVEYLKSLNINCKNRYDVVIVPKFYDGFWDLVVNNIKNDGRSVKIFIAANEDIQEKMDLYPDSVSIGLDVEKIACANLVLSERFHPNLVAMYFGIPFVSINSRKTEHFSKEFLKDYKGFSKKNVQDVLFKVRKVEKEKLEIREILNKKYDIMIEKLRDLTKNL